jgi:acyl-CoA reductase-like NAD-dependent aldehyde dehydrogenase
MNKEELLNTLTSSCDELEKQTGHQRSLVLKNIAAGLSSSKKEIASLISKEAKKPIKYALQEVARSILVFEIAAEETKRQPREYIDLDWTSGPAKQGLVKHFPIGPVLGITPFNFPLNLVAHKLAPAIAAGCPIVIKPSPKTPLVAQKLIDIVKGSGAVANSVQCIELSNEEVHEWVADDRFAMVSFTGSAEVGWHLKSIAGKKKVMLELGGNAGTIITPTADLVQAAKRCTIGGYAYAGQVCIHTQRIYVHDSCFEHFVEQLSANISHLKMGELTDPSTDFGEMITEEAAVRVEKWIDEAIKQGAKIVIGGKRQGNLIEPTLLTNTKATMNVVCEEIFGPVVIVERYALFSEAIDAINNGRFGLQAGIFTDSHQEIQDAFHQLKVGAVIVNDVPTFRADHMPYGGIKDSGFGREGIKYVIQELTEPRLLVI